MSKTKVFTNRKVMCCGEMRPEANCIRFGTYADYDDLFFYKNGHAFNDKTNEICYALPPRHMLNDDVLVDTEWPLPECKLYTYQDILDICNGNEKVAEAIFAKLRGKSPESSYLTARCDPIWMQEVAAGVKVADGFELLEFIPDSCKYYPNRPELNVPLFYACVEDVYVAYFGDATAKDAFDPDKLRIVEPDTPCSVDIGSLPSFQTSRDIRFTSVSSAKLPVFADSYNAMMVEKTMFRIENMAKNGMVAASETRGLKEQQTNRGYKAL